MRQGLSVNLNRNDLKHVCEKEVSQCFDIFVSSDSNKKNKNYL